MKKTFIFYLFLFCGIMIIFNLYNKNHNLSGEVIKNEEVMVFYEVDNEVVGCTQTLYDDEIIDIFNYLTIKRNNSPESFISPNIYLELKDYEISNRTLTLYLSKDFLNLDNRILNSFITLLYESYHILGYEVLIINSNDLIFEYDKEEIFKFNQYKNYKKKSNDGCIAYLYYLDGDYINFESILYDYDDEISYKMEKLYSSIEYEVSTNLIKIYYNEEDYEYDYLIKSLEYNFYGYDFTLIKL